MFERYTEKARRVIFFARYEASHYGSHTIESEHLLLGLLREDQALTTWFLGKGRVGTEIRAEIESRVSPGERFSFSEEVPLSAESRSILDLAADEADRLAHRHIGTEHMLLGILRVEDSLAARILFRRGLKPEKIREQLAKYSGPAMVEAPPARQAQLRLDRFLAGLKWHNAEELAAFFSKNGHFVDVSGKRWNREEIGREFETLFATYAKKNTTYIIEETLADTGDLFVAMVLWKNAMLASEHRNWVHRMSVVLAPEDKEWQILIAHVTPVLLP